MHDTWLLSLIEHMLPLAEVPIHCMVASSLDVCIK